MRNCRNDCGRLFPANEAEDDDLTKLKGFVDYLKILFLSLD